MAKNQEHESWFVCIEFAILFLFKGQGRDSIILTELISTVANVYQAVTMYKTLGETISSHMCTPPSRQLYELVIGAFTLEMKSRVKCGKVR